MLVKACLFYVYLKPVNFMLLKLFCFKFVGLKLAGFTLAFLLLVYNRFIYRLHQATPKELCSSGHDLRRKACGGNLHTVPTCCS